MILTHYAQCHDTNTMAGNEERNRVDVWHRDKHQFSNCGGCTRKSELYAQKDGIAHACKQCSMDCPNRRQEVEISHGWEVEFYHDHTKTHYGRWLALQLTAPKSLSKLKHELKQSTRKTHYLQCGATTLTSSARRITQFEPSTEPTQSEQLLAEKLSKFVSFGRKIQIWTRAWLR